MSDETARAAEWIYRGLWSILVRWFRVPDRPPTLPSHPGATVDTFQPAEGFLRYLKLYFWVLSILIDLAIFVGFVVLALVLVHEDLWWLAILLAPPVLLLMVVPDVVAYVAIHLRFDTTYYVMDDRTLRVRRGVWIIQETTITFENVQNLRISRGPVQQLYGIADLVVETAGAGGDSQGPTFARTANRGIVEGIAHAEALRDRILPHLRRTARAGLGDEHEGGAGGDWTEEHVAALRAIRDEVRAPAAGA